MLFDLNNVCLIPAVTSGVSSRKECIPYYGESLLPVIASPMSCILNRENIDLFTQKGILAVLPRSIMLDIRYWYSLYKGFTAFGLEELEGILKNNEYLKLNNEVPGGGLIALDIAQGQMSCAIELIRDAVKHKIRVMAPNIANPETYEIYHKVGAHCVRIGIGTGDVCITRTVTGMGLPMGYLIKEVYKIKKFYQQRGQRAPNIIADGGFDSNDKIIKALALGADFCMLGKLFAQTEESCGYERIIDDVKYKEYYGMSTKKAQREFGKSGDREEEGISKLVEVKYTLDQWINRFKHDLTSAMSYAGHRTLSDFKGNVNYKLLKI